ncbi:hypothetical protein FBUS_03502 [Fasciolopsis buskii]|uniref:Uncharacterized protein n=1 Tax=Fasciolopsis buskii TaxID=27845 RepID=A0A8E0VL98_9TREM|nr:hypothetical protein FBUS_03502 [Fasciolopsis buski]
MRRVVTNALPVGAISRRKNRDPPKALADSNLPNPKWNKDRARIY